MKISIIITIVICIAAVFPLSTLVANATGLEAGKEADMSENEEVLIPLVISITEGIAGAQFKFSYTEGLSFLEYRPSNDIRRGAARTPVVEKGEYTYLGFYNVENRFVPIDGLLDAGYLVFISKGSGKQNVTLSETKTVRVVGKGTESELAGPIRMNVNEDGTVEVEPEPEPEIEIQSGLEPGLESEPVVKPELELKSEPVVKPDVGAGVANEQAPSETAGSVSSGVTSGNINAVDAYTGGVGSDSANQIADASLNGNANGSAMEDEKQEDRIISDTAGVNVTRTVISAAVPAGEDISSGSAELDGSGNMTASGGDGVPHGEGTAPDDESVSGAVQISDEAGDEAGSIEDDGMTGVSKDGNESEDQDIVASEVDNEISGVDEGNDGDVGEVVWWVALTASLVSVLALTYNFFARKKKKTTEDVKKVDLPVTKELL